MAQTLRRFDDLLTNSTVAIVMDVGAAYADTGDADQDLIGSGRGNRAGLYLYLAGLEQNGSTH